MERLGKRVKFILFFSAYFPLFSIIVIKNLSLISKSITDFKFTAFKESLMSLTLSFWLIITPFLFSICAVLIFIFFIKFHEKLAADAEYEIVEYKDNACEIISFILTYIIPFLQPNLTNRYDILCIYILIALIGLIYVNSNMLYVNPLFYVLGYNTIELDLKDNNTQEAKKIILLIKTKEKNLKKGDKINVKLIDDNFKNIYFFKSKTK